MRARLLLLAALPVTLLAQPRKVIIDQDVESASDSNLRSIAMCLHDSSVEVLGLTIQIGDGPRDPGVGHTLRLLEAAGRGDIPVVPGAAAPLVLTRPELLLWEKQFGRIGWKGAWSHPLDPQAEAAPLPGGPPSLRPSPEIAANFLVRMVRRYPGEVTIIAGGPATDIALASALDPAFAAAAKELVLFGGEFDLVTQRPKRRSFNWLFDPEAMRIVLHAPWRRIELIASGSMTGVVMTPAMEEALAQSPSPLVRHLLSQPNPNRTYPMWDEMGMAVWLDPSLVTQAVDLQIDVNLDRGKGYGSMLAWDRGAGPGLGEPLVHVVLGVDPVRFDQLFVEQVSRTGPVK